MNLKTHDTNERFNFSHSHLDQAGVNKEAHLTSENQKYNWCTIRSFLGETLTTGFLGIKHIHENSHIHTFFEWFLPEFIAFLPSYSLSWTINVLEAK